jgi:hypothetical protein
VTGPGCRTRQPRAIAIAMVVAAAALAGGAAATAAPPPAPAAPQPTAREAAATATAATATPAPSSAPGGLREPAPRPAAELRVQNRYAQNARAFQLFGGADFLERRDFYVSPGVRIGGTYFLAESLGLEVQISHFFSRLNQAALQVQQRYGVLPDSRAPGWLAVGGVRYAAGYGKMIVGGVNRAIHFQPQALAQVGLHVNDGTVGPSGLAGLGLLVHATPRWFFRLEAAATLDLERRVTGTATVLGFLPSLVTGGTL